MTPFVSDPDMTLYVGDCLDVLRSLPDGCVDCCVTSPPYWGLRDYGTEGQLGLEASPAEYVAAMVAVFREVRRVLADHGTLWLNLGDSYNNRNTSRQSSHQGGLGFESDDLSKSWAQLTSEGRTRLSIENGDLKEKDLVGIPWMLAFALRADGWYLRSDIIWAKPNPMPESVTDRPTKAHEYVFLLSKEPRYFFDQEAVREPAQDWSSGGPGVGILETHHYGADNGGNSGLSSLAQRYKNGDAPSGRNVRSVWQIATQPYADAHFATFPEELPRRCILAGCPEWVCSVCGKARERIVEASGGTIGRSWHDHDADLAVGQRAEQAAKGGKGYSRETVGWSDCGHNDYQPGTVLDPFFGSGTTGLVARKHGRHTIGIELNPDYARMAARRLQQLSLLA